MGGGGSWRGRGCAMILLQHRHARLQTHTRTRTQSILANRYLCTEPPCFQPDVCASLVLEPTCPAARRLRGHRGMHALPTPCSAPMGLALQPPMTSDPHPPSPLTSVVAHV